MEAKEELLEIHRLLMCVGSAPAPVEGEPYTLHGVKQLIERLKKNDKEEMRMDGKQNFLDEAISDGERASFGRLGSLIALIFSCIWISVLVWRVKQFVDLPNLAIFIGACGAFISLLYGISKYNDRKEATEALKAAAEGLPAAPGA